MKDISIIAKIIAVIFITIFAFAIITESLRMVSKNSTIENYIGLIIIILTPFTAFLFIKFIFKSKPKKNHEKTI
jgi:hypothetical protein